MAVTLLRSTASGGADGANPTAGLIMDKSGNLYGTATAGGAALGCSNSLGTQGCGTVFQLTPGGSTFNVLYTFAAGTDAANPGASLIMDPAGNLYSTAVIGGVNDAGAVFQLIPTTAPPLKKKPLQLLLPIRREPPPFCTDGVNPVASLIMDPAGNLYGTTWGGGASSIGGGTVFQLTPNPTLPWTETVLYSFCSQSNFTDGFFPSANLLADSSGNLYSTTPLAAPTAAAPCSS